MSRGRVLRKNACEGLELAINEPGRTASGVITKGHIFSRGEEVSEPAVNQVFPNQVKMSSAVLDHSGQMGRRARRCPSYS